MLLEDHCSNVIHVPTYLVTKFRKVPTYVYIYLSIYLHVRNKDILCYIHIESWTYPTKSRSVRCRTGKQVPVDATFTYIMSYLWRRAF